MKPRLLVIIPAFNEQETVGDVISAIPAAILGVRHTVVVINDGSTDATVQEAYQAGVHVISHRLNRGLGGALGTGFAFAEKENYDLLVTLDADGQHNPKDIPRLIDPIIRGTADVVIGSRIASRTMPLLRKIVNILSNIATLVLFGIVTSDSQSGLRAFSKKAFHNISIKTQGMEVSSEIFREIKKHHLHKVEIPIEAIYTNYSLRKGQQITNALNVFWKLILHQFRFI